MQQFPQLESERLILNQPNSEDTADLILYLNQTSEFADNTLTMPFPYTEESAQFWLKMIEDGFEKKDAFVFGIRKKENLKLIGGIGLHLVVPHQKAELGYWIAKDFWNQGYATEAAKTVVEFGFRILNLNKIYASHYPHNPASGKILQKIGMQYEATLKDEVLKKEKFLDLIRYSILKNNY